MRIAIITSGFLPIPATKGGAVENLVVNILKENEKNKFINFEVLSIYDKDAEIESKLYKNSSFKFIKTNVIVELLDKIMFSIAKNILRKENSQSYRYIFQRLYYLNKVSIILKKNNYDSILLENHPTQYLALKWRKNYQKYANRYYYHCHNEFPGMYGCKKIIEGTNKIICVSQFIANSISNYTGLSKEKFVVLRNCVDFDKFRNTTTKEEIIELKEKYNINSTDKVMLFTGRIVPEKGVKELIKSLKNLKFKNYKLLILGSALNELATKTEYQTEIEKLVNEVENNVVFTGFIKYDEISKFYALADLAVLPSIWNDPAPLTIIESLVSGLPIITTNSGGIPEYATNSSAVILERDEKLVINLTNTIDELLKKPNKLEEMSKIAKEVSKDLTLENYYLNFYEIIKNKLGDL